MDVLFDASDFDRVAKIYQRMPADLQKIAFRRAAGRARSVVERDYARFASRTLKIAQKLVKERMKSQLTGTDNILDVKSTQIPLHEMGAQQRGYGVYVRGRSRYEHAFIAKQSSKRAAGLVLLRKGKDRTPTMMLFGPNPANAINRKPADYEDILAEIAAGEFAKTILQQAEYLLGRAG
ncbi:hypothetical protein JYU29_05745 [Tianweitania sp. BSSL-BM11]|uniref:HK97 gp10 family phage protein n=1 Tax=Tianweitania aestuarii TaxID=2814886 RepID=A0ABS5RT09_9HYPH|nr:hypothetical protein [Tianweitania aestuarii]MBS9720189.1 hypothetical protein [Tianweitania aestuarii]